MKKHKGRVLPVIFFCVSLSATSTVAYAAPASPRPTGTTDKTPSVVEDQSPYNWNISNNVSLVFGGYVQADAYGVSRSNASFGTGAIDGRPLDTYIRRAYGFVKGKIYDWSSFFLYDFSSHGKSVDNGIVWAWVTHDLGPGELSLGQHWTYATVEEPVSAASLNFLERNFLSSNGLDGLRSHVQGVFYQVSQPFGGGNNNIFLSGSLYTLNDSLVGRDDASGYGATVAARWAPLVTKDKWYQVGTSFSYANAHNEKYGLDSVVTTYTGSSHLPNIDVGDFKKSLGTSSPESYRGSVNLMGSYGSFFALGEYAVDRYTQECEKNSNLDALSIEVGYWLTGEMTPFSPKVASYSAPRPLHNYGAWQITAGYGYIENLDARNARTSRPECIPGATSEAFSQSEVNRCRIQRYRVATNFWVDPKIRFTAQISKSIADLGNAGKDDPLTIELRAQWGF